MKYVLGLDLGIASIGWALLLQDDNGVLIRIVNLGVRTFSEIENSDGKLENQLRREKRGQRRLRRRKRLRLDDLTKLIESDLGVIIKTKDNIPFKNYDNPYELKIKGLNSKLEKEELAIALYHYMKYRGFKSNRKVEDKASAENGKLLKKLEEINAALLDSQKTITEYLYNEFLLKDKKEQRIHNEGTEYRFSATRKMYVDEITQLLDKQIFYGVITPEFKDKYLSIFERQRSFSVGPGKGSPFAAKEGKSLIESTIGNCVFDKNIRAPKQSFSAETMVLLSFLNNLRIKENIADKYIGLTGEQIKQVYQIALSKKEIKYRDLNKILGIKIGFIKGLTETKKQRQDWLSKYKKDNNINGALPVELYNEFNDYCKDKILDSKIPSLKGYLEQKSIIEKELKKANNELAKEIKEFISCKENFDKISLILMTRKTDEEIIKACKDIGLSNEFASIIIQLPEIKQTINLSIELCRKINPLLLDGNDYDKAMNQFGYDHSKPIENIEKSDFLPDIDSCMKQLGERLTNHVVRHTLVEMRKLINAIIKKYGPLSQINIETARDLAKNKQDRRNIQNEQLDHMDENIRIKNELVTKYPERFKTYSNVKNEDIVKYRLFKEQNGCCVYSGAKINENLLFTNEYQIDHILPYSRTFENRYFNKVLVSTKYNQEKGNKTPYEAFKGNDWQRIINFINNPLVKMSNKKKETILTKELDEKDFKEHNINDTRYISVLAIKIVTNFLKLEYKCLAPCGAITDFMKGSYGLKGLTHSYINPEYKNNDEYFLLRDDVTYDKDKITFKIRNSRNQIFMIDVKKISSKEGKELPRFVIDTNNAISFFIDNFDLCLDEIVINGLKERELKQIITTISNNIMKYNDVNHNILYNKIMLVISEIQAQIDKITLSKDRSNHLHHALDAVMIAIVNNKIINNISNYAKTKETLVDPETGEVVKQFKLKDPYKEFRSEVIYRVYERDYNTLIRKLAILGNYKNLDMKKEDIYVIYPSRSPITNIKGPFTEETMFGRTNDVITKKIDVNKITKKNFESIIATPGNKALREAVSKWILEDPNTRSKYPILPGKGNYIKKVTVIESENVQKRVLVKKETQAFASNPSCSRVDIYQKVNEPNKYYMVPVYYRQIAKKKIGQEELYEIMWAQNDNHDYITSKKLQHEFIKIAELPRYSLIEIELNSGAKGYCYTGGATSGNFEVYSILGDAFDLITYSLYKNIMDRYRLTISTIKSIKVHNISLLGKIS